MRSASGEPVKDAIAALDPAQPKADGVIEIALGERVHPRKGLELAIAQHGICRAITYFEQFPDLENRGRNAMRCLVRTLHRELVANLRRAIAQHEGQAPDSASVPELISRTRLAVRRIRFLCRHLARGLCDPVRHDLEDAGAIRLALELCEYGAHLSPQFKLRGEPPFDDLYVDHATYLRALLGEDGRGRGRAFSA